MRAARWSVAALSRALAHGKIMSNKPEIYFVCAKMSMADAMAGEPFSGAAGRELYLRCMRPLGLRRADVGLVSLDKSSVPADGVVIAVGAPAAKALGDRALVAIPHPSAILRKKDTGETLRKMVRVQSIIKSAEDAQGEWVGTWHAFVPPGGGRYVYQKHTRGNNVHYDLRLSSKKNGQAWGWTIVGGNPLTSGSRKVLPKKEHPDNWMSQNGNLPGGDNMEILASGEYQTGLCHNACCELILTGLTGGESTDRVVITSSEKNDDGVPQWVSIMPKERAQISERKSIAEITGDMDQDEKVIYDGQLVSAGAVAEKMSVEIVKSMSEKQVVYGPVIDPYIADAHNDWTPPDETERLAHEFISGDRAIGFMHVAKDGESYPVESWLVPYPSAEDYRLAMAGKPHKVLEQRFGDRKIRSGTWMLGVKCSDRLWALHKEGKLNAFSPGGLGRRRVIDASEMPKVEVVDAT